MLYSRHRRLLYSLAYRVLQNHEEAEDAVQNSLLLAFRNLPRFEYQGAFRSWLARILINEAIGILRKRKSRPAIVTKPAPEEEQEDWLDSFSSEQPNPEQALIRLEFVTALKHCMARLSTPLRSAIVLCDIDEDTIEEASVKLGVKPNTIKARLFRARRKLQQKMFAPRVQLKTNASTPAGILSIHQVKASCAGTIQKTQLVSTAAGRLGPEPNGAFPGSTIGR